MVVLFFQKYLSTHKDILAVFHFLLLVHHIEGVVFPRGLVRQEPAQDPLMAEQVDGKWIPDPARMHGCMK